MLRLAVIVAFTVSLFVGRVCPVPQKGGANAVVTASMSTTKKTVANNTTEVPRAADKPANNDEVTTIKGETGKKATCNITNESYDMLHSAVSPTDDDDDVDATPSLNSTEPTTLGTTVKNESSSESTVTPPLEFVPAKGSKSGTETSIKMLNQTNYETVTAAMDHSTNANASGVSGTNTKLGTNHSDVSINSRETELINSIKSIKSEMVSKTEKSADENSDKSMSSGIIALVTAITFAVAAAIAYVGMIAWRRYLEYRYGHRELLVNELEFDTNDLRHFEL